MVCCAWLFNCHWTIPSAAKWKWAKKWVGTFGLCICLHYAFGKLQNFETLHMWSYIQKKSFEFVGEWSVLNVFIYSLLFFQNTNTFTPVKMVHSKVLNILASREVQLFIISLSQTIGCLFEKSLMMNVSHWSSINADKKPTENLWQVPQIFASILQSL